MIFELQLFNEENEIVEDMATNEVMESQEEVVESKEPFAVFPDQKTFMKRITREGRRQVNELLEGLGLESKEQLEQMVGQIQQQKEDEKTELQKLQDSLTSLQKENEKYKNEYSKLRANAIAEKQAIKLGVDPAKVDYFMKLVELSDPNDLESVEVDIKKVLDVMPEFGKKVNTTNKSALPLKTGVEPDNNKSSKSVLTNDIIKNMSTNEAMDRMDEIMEFLSNQ